MRAEVLKAMNAAQVGRSGCHVKLTGIFLDHVSLAELMQELPTRDVHTGRFCGVPLYVVHRMDSARQRHLHVTNKET